MASKFDRWTLRYASISTNQVHMNKPPYFNNLKLIHPINLGLIFNIIYPHKKKRAESGVYLGPLFSRRHLISWLVNFKTSRGNLKCVVLKVAL